MLNVAINGLGRIGRATFKILLSKPQMRLIAVNDLVPPSDLAYLLKFDSVYGRWDQPVTADDGLQGLAAAGRVVPEVIHRITEAHGSLVGFLWTIDRRNGTLKVAESTKFMGRGLGLSAALGIVRANHGAIHVSSSTGKGSVFTVFLPAPSKEHQEEREDDGNWKNSRAPDR